jgi:exodeoxyribonuclease VII small subunit
VSEETPVGEPPSKEPTVRTTRSEETPGPRAPSYEANVARVEEIIRRLDGGEASLTDTLQLVKEGKELIERCAGELESVGGALEELRLEDLVARLEDDGAKDGTG